jgi:hypothetical protein
VNIEKRLSNAYRHRESRFKALFPKRLNKVSSTITSLKKLSNKTNYVYDQVEIYNGLSSLILEINDLANAFGLDSSDINSDDNLYTEIKEIKEELTSLKIKLKRQEWNKRK